MNSNTNDQANTNVNPAQVQNYITWINSHLKKRPGVRLVENLHIDITNGVPLIHLIEVISGDVLADVILNPKSYNEYKENIDKVLKFMQQNSVKIARTTSKEILDGNIKSIMRVILALAAHFKPSNLQSAPSVSTHSSSAANRHSAASLTGPVSTCSLNNLNKPTNSNTNNILTQQNSKHNLNSTRTITNIDSMTHLVQAACVSFADVRRYKNENFNVKYVRRNNLLLNGQPTPTLSGSSNTAPTTNNTTSTKQHHSSKFNLTATICPTSTNLTDAVHSANILETNNNNINNRTYVTSQNPAQFDTLPNTSCKPAIQVEADETNFLNSVLLSPSSQQNPIASSTILSQTLPQAKQMEKEEKPNNKTYSIQTAQFVLENSKINLGINSMNKQNSAVNTPNDDQFECPQNDQLEVVPELLDDVKCLKNVLLNLQNMLMNGDLKDFEKISDFIGNGYENELNKNEETNDENTNSSNSYSNSSNNDSMDNEFALANLSKDEQIAILRSKIQQLEIVCNDLRSELNQTKCESMNNCGLQNGLKSRLTELDNSMLEMKSEQLNLQLSNQHLLKEKEKCISLLDLQVAEINKLKAELITRDETIDKMKLEMNSLLKTDLLKKQMKNIADIEEIQEKESVLSGLIANRKLCIIDSKLSGAKKTDATFIVNKNKQQQQPTIHTTASTAKPIITEEETTALRDTLNQLRHNFKPSHPSLFLIDTLEQRILAISERSNTNLADSEIEIMNFVSAKSNNTVPVPNSIGLITSSTSSINSSSSTSSNSSSLASSSANSPVLSTINQFQTNISQPQTCTIYTAINQPSSFQRFQPSLSTNNNNLKRIEITKTLKNGEVELPIVNNSEQTNVKKIISRLLSQNSTSGGGNSISSTVSTTSNQNQQSNTHYLKKKIDSEFISSSSTHPIEKMQNLIGKSSCPSPMLLTISSSGSVATSTSSSSSSNHSPASSSSSSNSSIGNMIHQTKCIYFKNKEVTPYMTSILKGVKNVTLWDFKERISKQLDNTKRYRFYFKSHEPEFGYLKEEITNDNTLLPTFENQIVAWVIENE